MKRNAGLGAVLLVAGLSAGCVERRMVIYSDPPGALVYVNNQYVGATPVDYWWVYYGKYHFTLVKDGYETLNVQQDVPAPWYEWPGADFISEVQPFKVRDVRSFCYTLQPMLQVQPEDLRRRADELRARGQAIGTPAEPRPVAPGPPAVPPPTPPGPVLGPPAEPPITPAPPPNASPGSAG
jgi:hypothetical protein